MHEYTLELFKYKDDAPQYRDNAWPAAFENQHFFGPLSKTTYDNTLPSVSRQDIIDRAFSTSFIGKQNPEEAKKITAALNELLDRHNICPGSETSTFPYKTDLFLTQRL